jgi:hypothetical protein
MEFESVLQACLRAGLVGGVTLATDASMIEADARVARRTEGKEAPDDWNDPGKVTRPVREYLDQLDKAAGLGALPGESPQPPKSVSLTDPQAAFDQQRPQQDRLRLRHQLPDRHTKAAIIVDVEASPARWTAEVAATCTMIERAAKRFGLCPKRLVAWRAGMDKKIEAAQREQAEAARSGLIFDGQGQARLHLKSRPPWSHQWVQSTMRAVMLRFRLMGRSPEKAE